jgi:photosystem II stability/assembly factor-like uncharacterized protein/PKD repeat protein
MLPYSNTTIMKLFYLSLVFINTIFSINAQWSQYPSIPMLNIKAVQAWDENIIYASQPEQILRSTDGGSTWATLPIVDAGGNLIITTNFYDFHILSPGVIVAVGLAFMGNDETIFKSTNYGVSWSMVHAYGGGIYPRITNAVHFPSSTVGYVACTNGRILKTTNGGDTWTTLSTGNTFELKDIYFTNNNIGYAVGNSRLFKTTNGGSSWTGVDLSGNIFNAIHFPSSNVGYAVGDDRKILKTVNGGTNWTLSTANIPSNFSITSVYFVSEEDGYITGANGEIYHTTSGGQYWEKTVLNNALNDVFFLNQTSGFLAGDLGQLLHTNTIGSYSPVANFTSSNAIVCNDSTLSFENTSDPSLSFQWLFNGVPFSTDYNSSYTFTDPGQSDTISLVTFNGTYYDSLKRIISVQPSLEFNLNGGILSYEVCSGQSTSMFVYNSIPGIVYSLTKNGIQVGSTQNGSGGTLTFSTGAITVNSTVCVKGVKTIGGCGSNTETWCTTVTIQNPDPTIINELSEDTVCVGSPSSVLLYQSQFGVSYQLFQGTNLVGLAQIGNGGTLTFFTFPNSSNTTYFIRATSPLGCTTNYPSMTVYIQNPGVFWTLTTLNPEIGESVNMINNSTYIEGSFSWNFGPNANPSSSNLTEPQNVVFDSEGLVDVSLTCITPLGCTQTVTKKVNIIQPFTEESCDAVYLNSYSVFSSRLSSIHRDNNDNIYGVYKHSLSPNNYTHSNHGDSMNLGLTSMMNFDKSYTLIKYNSKGVPMWSTNLRSDTSGDGGDVITDANGNVYMAYYHDDFGDSLRIYSSDGRFISIMPPTSSATSHSMVIVKFDPNGIYLWHTTFFDNYAVWKVSIKLDDEENLFVNGLVRCVKYNSNGILQWQITGNLSDNEPDQDGGVFLLRSTGLIIDHYNSSGLLISSSLALPTLATSTVIGARHLAQDENGSLYALGNFRGSFIFGMDTLTDIFTSGSSHEDVFFAKFSKNLEPIWIKQFKGPLAMPIQGVDILNNTVLIGFLNTGSTMTYIQRDINFTDVSNSYFLFKCDTLGTTDEISLFYNSTATTIGSNLPLDNVVLRNNGNSFDFGFQFTDDFTASTGTQFVMNPNTGYKHYGINLAEISCVFTQSPPLDIPIAYYSAPINICQGETIIFNDGSLNNPTQWSWTFEDGSILTSTDPNPTVIFNTIGVHLITLTVSNSFGQSEAYTSYVNVFSPPTATIYASDYACSGSATSACVNTSNAFYWPNGLSTNCYETAILNSDTTIYLTVINSGCTVQFPISFQIESVPVITMDGELPDSVCSNQSAFSLPIPIPSGGTFTTNSAVFGTTFTPGNGATDLYNHVIYNYYTPNANCLAQWVDSIYIVNSNLWATIVCETSSCEGYEVAFYSTASSNATNYLWNFSGAISSNTTTPTTTALFSESGTYIISLVVSNGPCAAAPVYESIYIEETPIVEITQFNPDVLCSDVGLISAPTATPSGGYYYDQQGAFYTETLLDPNLMIIDEANYIYYAYTSPVGCYGVDSTTITITDCANLSELNQSTEIYVYQGNNPHIFFVNNIPAGVIVDLYNPIGQIIREYESDSKPLTFDLTNEATGIYLLSLDINNNKLIIRIYNQ